MRLRRAGSERVAAIGRRGQGLVVDFNQRRRVLGDVAILRHHDGDGLADMHRLVARECRPVEILLIARAR